MRLHRLRLLQLASCGTMSEEASTDEKEVQKPSMKPFPWLYEQLARDALDQTVLPFQDGQPLPPLLPDALAASFSIRVGDHQAHFFYPLDTRHHSTVRSAGGESPAHTISPPLPQLLDQFVCAPEKGSAR